jgi:ribonucleoside-diphosphate reductase alpha chain
MKQLGLWTEEMRDKVKYYDGSVQEIDEVPQHLKDKYKTAFEIDPLWLIKITAARGKWIDQSQSHNVFMKGVSGKKLHDLYMAGWSLGLKTFYYLRTLGASQIEKSTLDATKYGFTQMREYKKVEVAADKDTLVKNEEVQQEQEITQLATKACRLEDPDCESCQ